MGIFNFFKKTADAPNLDPISLEDLLKKAATEPAFRAEFTKRLLSDDLIILTEGGSVEEGSHVLQENTSINILTLPDGRLPVFTSKERILDQNIIQEKMNFMQMSGRNLFEMTRGATFVLNPYSQYGKELLPDEIANMLDGTLTSSKKITVQKDTEVQIGQPAKYPVEMIASLCRLFADRHNVKAAFLGWIFDPESGDAPHYIFSIDADGDFQSTVNEAGFTAEQYLEKHEIVDFVKFGNGTLDDYFESVTPFYQR